MPVIRSRKWALVLAVVVETLLCIVPAVLPVPALAAATALIIGATGVPDPADNPTYIPDTRRLYFPFTACRDNQCQITPIITPQQLFPLVGTLTLDESVSEGFDIVDAAVADQLRSDPAGHVVIAGGSQGAIIAALEKRKLAGEHGRPPAGQIEFVLFDNQTRPNGGLLSRFPTGFSITAVGISAQPPAPTDTGSHTIDVAMQYDGYSDFPVFPVNLLAVANAVAGTFYIHGSDIGNVAPFPTTRTGPDGYSDEEFRTMLDDPANRQTYGDTTYITIPTRSLPILQPLRDFGAFTGTSVITTPLADFVEPTLRVLIETGYDRTIPYGQPTTFRLLPEVNPLMLTADLLHAGVEGVGAALHDLLTATTTSESRQQFPTSPAREQQSHATATRVMLAAAGLDAASAAGGTARRTVETPTGNRSQAAPRGRAAHVAYAPTRPHRGDTSSGSRTHSIADETAQTVNIHPPNTKVVRRRAVTSPRLQRATANAVESTMTVRRMRLARY